MADPPQSTTQFAVPRLDASGDREVVYCHLCSNEWWKDEHGLTCPRCEGDATEIVGHS
jgi:Zn finger protein HypA/HybF involved in hydrogenase expression